MKNKSNTIITLSKYIDLAKYINKNTKSQYMKSTTTSNLSYISAFSNIEQGVGKLFHSTVEFQKINNPNLFTKEEKNIWDILNTDNISKTSSKVNKIYISNKNETPEAIINMYSLNSTKHKYKNISHKNCILNL